MLFVIQEKAESLRTKVSVAGKRNFQGRDREAETATKVQGRPCRDKISLANPANSGLIAENGEFTSNQAVMTPFETSDGKVLYPPASA